MYQLFIFFLLFVVDLCVCRLGEGVIPVIPPARNGESDVLNDVFFIEQSESCSEENSLAHVLTKADSSLFPAGLHHTLEAELRDVAEAHRRRRLQETETGRPTVIDSFGRLSIEERRDQVVAALDIMYRRKTFGDAPSARFSNLLPGSWANQSPHSSVRAHLEHLGIDIINNLKVDNTDMLTMAAALPCQKYHPETNLRRYPNQVNVVIPNDSFLLPHNGTTGQWHLSGPGIAEYPIPYGADVFRAWSIYRGETKPPVVAVLDTGCSMHPDLENNLCTKGEDCAGYDFGEGNDNPHNEKQFHGTSVAAMIAGVPHNSFLVAGVCWNCKIMCLKIADSTGELSARAALEAMNYILGKKVKITNHSYTGYQPSRAEISAIESLRRSGVLVVAAAGNDNCNVDANLEYATKDRCRHEKTKQLLGQPVPVGYTHDNIIGVGASNITGERAWFSNYGSISVDVMGPGDLVTLAVNTRQWRSGIAYVSGTSFSAPLTAGIAALLWGRSPNSTYLDIKRAIMMSVVRSELFKDNTVSGGIINAVAALRAIEQIENEKGAANFVSDPPTMRVLSAPTIDNTEQYYSYGNARQLSATGMSQFFALGGLIIVSQFF